MLASITVKKKPHVGAETGMGAPHCGFRRYMWFLPGLTLQIKFAYSLNRLKYQLSQSKLFGQALRIIAAFFLLSSARTAAHYHKHLSPDSSGPDDGRAHTSAPPSPL